MILTLPIPKIFVKSYACYLVCRLELLFPYLSCQKFRENCMYLRFLAENRFLPILCVYVQYVQNFEVALTLGRHSDFIRRRMVLILVSMERGHS